MSTKQKMQELTLEKLKKAVPLRDPREFYDDWDDAEVDAAYADALREGYLALAESHRADAELFFRHRLRCCKMNDLRLRNAVGFNDNELYAINCEGHFDPHA